MTAFWLLVLFGFGLIVGSFLNVCVYRLPRGKSLIRPRRSYCPHCHEQILWHDNIPVFSYLLLGRMCRSCGSLISRRYVVIEALTAVMLTGLVYWLHRRGEMPGTMVVYGAAACLLLVASCIDLELRIIPDEITLGGAIFAPPLCALFPSVHNAPMYGRSFLFFASPFWGALAASLTGMAVGAFLVYGSGVLGKLLFRRESMGLGDVKFMAFLGAILGWKLVILAFALSAVFGMVYGLIHLLRTGDHHIAYGPFLSAGALVAMLAGDRVLALIGADWLFLPLS